MTFMPSPIADNNKSGLRRRIYAAGLFLTLNSSLISYVNSSFLSEIVGEKWVGLVYILSSLVTIISFLFLPRILSRRDLRTILLVLAAAAAAAAAGLGLIAQPAALLLAVFIFFFASGSLLRYSLDLYLEAASADRLTGSIRGVFLTVINLAWLFSPYISGLILDGGTNYPLVYLAAAGAGLPLILILLFGLPPRPATAAPTSGLGTALRIFFFPSSTRENDIRNALAIDFLLNFFYAVMVVYTPLYLHQHIGLSWDEIGLVFTIMLLPFVLLDYPLGRLSDRYCGEKEILVFGLIIMAGATITIAFVPGASLIAWASVLFLSRVGAASVEVAKETYLFKHLGPDDVSLLSLSRMIVPFSYIIGPTFATIFLSFFDFRYIFAALGFIVLFGLRYALALVDTK